MSTLSRMKPDIPVCQARTIGELVRSAAQEHGERPLLYYMESMMTYREADQQSDWIAAAIQGIGLEKGERAAIYLPNCPDFVLVWFALMKNGMIEVPINVEQKGELLQYLLNNCQARMLVTSCEMLPQVQQVIGQLTHLQHIVLIDGAAAVAHELASAAVSVHLLADWKQRPAIPQAVAVSPGDSFCFMYTSGTTGNSKGVMLPHNFAIYSGDVIKHYFGYSEQDIAYICLPLFHGNAQQLAIMPTMIAGGAFVLERKFSLSQFWERVRKSKATIANVVGSIVAMLHKAPPSERDRDHSLRFVFTAATPKLLQRDFEERFGLTIMEGYGTTECGMVLLNQQDNRRVGSIGRGVPGYQVRIFDETDHALGPNQIGEIVTRPTYPSVMMTGYFNMPEATLEATRNLWYHTGDLGYYDEDGFYYYVDRKKDSIRRRGENISSIELERLINMHPEVVEAAVIGVPSELGEEEIKAFVVRQPGSSLTPADFIAWCEEKMARYMVPRYLEWVTELPKTPTQRIQKYKLKQQVQNEQTWDRESGVTR